MLYYDRIDVSEGIVINKASALQGCDICQYWYFSHYSFTFQRNVCNRFRDLLMMSINLNDIAVLNIKRYDYHCIISLINIYEAIKLMQNADLTKKNWNIIKHEKFIFTYKNG